MSVFFISLKEQPNIAVTYFFSDNKKAGDCHTTLSGKGTSWDGIKHQIILADGTSIPIEDVRFIEGRLFDAYEQY